MGIYGDLQKLNQAQKTSLPQAESPTPVAAASTVPAAEPTQTSLAEAPVIVKRDVIGSSKTKKPHRDTRPPRYRDTTVSSHQDTKQPRYRDTTIETIRAAVKVFGKEAATHRFTLEEKQAIRDIVYAYEAQGVRTNENVISRIGVNFLIEDYAANGENSILHRVLKALNG